MRAFGAICLLFALTACGDSREEQRRKQKELLRQQSSKWTEEQKNYRLPDLGNKDAHTKSDQKGTKK